jgi:hypothetical protein
VGIVIKLVKVPLEVVAKAEVELFGWYVHAMIAFSASFWHNFTLALRSLKYKVCIIQDTKSDAKN